MADVNITVVNDEQVIVQVVNETINILVSDIPLPLEMYQKRIATGTTPPAHPEVNDLWLDTSV